MLWIDCTTARQRPAISRTTIRPRASLLRREPLWGRRTHLPCHPRVSAHTPGDDRLPARWTWFWGYHAVLLPAPFLTWRALGRDRVAACAVVLGALLHQVPAAILVAQGGRYASAASPLRTAPSLRLWKEVIQECNIALAILPAPRLSKPVSERRRDDALKRAARVLGKDCEPPSALWSRQWSFD